MWDNKRETSGKIFAAEAIFLLLTFAKSKGIVKTIKAKMKTITNGRSSFFAMAVVFSVGPNYKTESI